LHPVCIHLAAVFIKRRIMNSNLFEFAYPILLASSRHTLGREHLDGFNH